MNTPVFFIVRADDLPPEQRLESEYWIQMLVCFGNQIMSCTHPFGWN